MYWPFCSSDFSTYGTVYVQCVEEKVYKNYTLRKLAVWKVGVQYIRQITLIIFLTREQIHNNCFNKTGETIPINYFKYI